jgi:VWFA-related protein
MTRRFIFLAFVLLCAGIPAAHVRAQTATATPDTDVVKITSKIVQLDLIVVDKDGKQVTDLTAADFEILEDRKPQKISGFSYVDKVSQLAQSPSIKKEVEKAGAIPPPVKLTPSNAGRVITFIVDDGNCAYSTTAATASREGIQKFIREQMLPTDLVAIYQTRSGTSVFQQYTNDRAHLLKTVRKIIWYPASGSCSSGDGSFFAAARSNTYIKRTPGSTTTETIESENDKKARENSEDQVNNNQVVGTLGVIRYVLKGLQRLPGRKVVFFLSDGMPLVGRGGEILSAADALQELTEISNRASVVFNTIDARGVFSPTMIEARDEVYGDDFTESDRVGQDRARSVANSRDGLAFLARETGGRFYQNQNYFDHPIKKVLSLETGYYLIAYEPSDETFKGKKFHKIEVKVKQPGLKVVSRTGFVGVVTETSKPLRRSEHSELYEAIISPLPVPGFDVDLAAYFGNSAETGNFVRSFFHLSGSDIRFFDEPGGNKKAVLDVVAVTMNEKSEVVDEFTRTHTIKLDAASLAAVRQNGLVYSADVPIKKPGTYNFRVAVRDSSGMLGSAGQMVEVPDLRKSRLFLSGLTVTQADGEGKFVLPGASAAASAFSVPGTTAVYAIRGFRPGTVLAYAYTIYNARLNNASGRPEMTVQVNLYKDGKLVLEGAPQSADFQKQADWSRIQDFGYMRLKPEMEPGSYTMQVVVKDMLADPKKAGSSQWVDFEVLN